MENGDSNSQSAGFEPLRRSCAGRSRRPWSPPCRARHEAAPEKGPGGSRLRASGGTGLLLRASLHRAGQTACEPRRSGAGLFTGKSREQERTRRLTPKPTGTTGFRGAGPASSPALRSRHGRARTCSPADLGARGVLLARRRLRDGAGGGGDPAAEGASNAHKPKESQYSYFLALVFLNILQIFQLCIFMSLFLSSFSFFF